MLYNLIYIIHTERLRNFITGKQIACSTRKGHLFLICKIVACEQHHGHSLQQPSAEHSGPQQEQRSYVLLESHVTEVPQGVKTWDLEPSTSLNLWADRVIPLPMLQNNSVPLTGEYTRNSPETGFSKDWCLPFEIRWHNLHYLQTNKSTQRSA